MKRYVYPDFKALRFRYKGGRINCFWKDLFRFYIKRNCYSIFGVNTIGFNLKRFVIFWESFFEGIKHLIRR